MYMLPTISNHSHAVTFDTMCIVKSIDDNHNNI